jgi:hypothetical protein
MDEPVKPFLRAATPEEIEQLKKIILVKVYPPKRPFLQELIYKTNRV